MDECIRCEAYVRERITELRMRKNVSEHRMSLELGERSSYIPGILKGTARRSWGELLNIIAYFDMSPSEFFSGLDDPSSVRTLLRERLLELGDEDLEKVSTFLDWIQK